jgi:hypothetical protein
VQTDAQILAMVKEAFALRRRPVHFTNFQHCDECAEHDALLRSRDLESLRFEDVGNPGWDPICFVSEEGFAYFMPALARLALSGMAKSNDWYISQLLFHLCHDGQNNRRFLACTPEQRRAVAELLKHVVETRAAEVDYERATDDLFHAIEIWSNESPTN